jgi:hypothetical protein
METPHQISPREAAIRRRLLADDEAYFRACLKILPKPDQVGRRELCPFVLNEAQRYVQSKLDAQLAEVGYVRAMILKGRQQGISTFVGARYYKKTTTQRGQNTYIITHSQEATENLFAMVQRYHDHNNPLWKPRVGKSNAKEFTFPGMSSKYQVSTAGSKEAGRSATLTNVHGSEVAFWENGETHLAGLMQAVALAPGTEILLESTANGVGNTFHKQWVAAEKGESDFIAIFVPWYWQSEYRRPVPPDFRLSDDPESVPEGELTEVEYARTFKLDNAQMFWRRRKIIELGGGEDGFYTFKQEYPATADEAFQSSSARSFIPRKAVLAARKSSVATAGDLIMGFDPAGESDDSDRSALIRRRTRRAFDPQAFSGKNTMQLAGLLYKIIKAEKPAKFFIDVGGIGKGVGDRLMEYDLPPGVVVPVNFGEGANDPEMYVNRRVEMYHELRDWLEQPGGANIPDTDEMQADLLATVADDDDSNQRRRLKSKKWMRQQGIRSPDFADALALTFAQPVSRMGQVVANSNIDFDVYSGDYDQAQVVNSEVDFDLY